MVLSMCRLLPAIVLLSFCACGSETAPKDWKAGGGGKDTPAVKDWKPRNFETVEALKTGYQPWCVYIYDADLKHNTAAYHYEGPKEGVLSNKETQDKLAGFAKIKIKSDGTDAKGWQEGWRKSADKGATLILMSADMAMVVVFDKSKEATERTPQKVAAAAASIKTYEDNKKAAAAKAEKEKEAKEAQIAAAAPPKEQDAGFKIDVKKPDPKPDPKGKKPVDKPADSKAVETKTDPTKKKAPEDE